MAMIPRDFCVFSADLAGYSPRSATTPGECLGSVATRVEKGGRAVRPIAVLLGVLLLVVAGCSCDDAPAEEAATTTQVPATTQPAAESTTSLSSAEAAVDVKVVYEPGNCTYLGPVVIPRGTKATFEFDDGGHAVNFVVGMVIDGTTREEIIEYSETRGGPNAGPLGEPYYSAGPFYYQPGAALLVVGFPDAGDWAVECLTPPDLTNKRYLGGMIKVIDG